MAVLDKVRTFFLGDAAKSKEERRLVRKLDVFIMTYCCFSYFFNFLDRAAFANAYVAGLREALNMTGVEYNGVLAITTAGMAVSQVFHGIIIQKVAPRIWLPSMVVVWAGLTMASAAVKTVSQLMAIRFLLGLAEGSTYAGTIYIIGSWYKPLEIAKRTAIFTASGQVGTMFAGVMMAAIYNGMGGLAGLAGWQWVFLIDGIITLPIALFGFFYFPDIPEITRAPWLTAKEKDLAVARLPPVAEGGHSVAPLSLLRRVALTPVFWLLLLWSPIAQTTEAYAVQNNLLIWLKYQQTHGGHFTQAQVNQYPLGVQAVGIAANMLAAWHMDATGRRVPMALLAAALQLVVASMLLVPTLPFAGTMFAFYLNGSAYMVNPLIFGWASVILQRSGDDAVRSVTVYCMNIGSMVLYTFWGVVFYSADDAPYWFKGGVAMIVACFIMMGYTFVIHWIDRTTMAKFKEAEAARAQADSKAELPEPSEKVSGEKETPKTAVAPQ
ncbi:hypothetical protein RB597_010249 [Gaeumannomyces tritici]